MAYRNLGEYLAELERRGELRRVKVEVDPVLEMAEVAARLVRRGGPAVLFEKARGSPYPVAMNLFGTPSRVRLALGDDPDEIGRRLASWLDLPRLESWGDRMRALPRLAQVASFFPRRVTRAPCQEVVEESPSLEKLPVLQCWPGDGGRFLTLPLVITRDPVSGKTNVGMYRMQVHDDRTLGMHWHVHKDGARHARALSPGERLPVAVALGGDPATIYAATAPLPAGLDEFLFAGFLRQAPVELVRAVTVDLEVPAEAEFVLEGYVEVGEERVEGPFGDHTGYYSPPEPYPVFHLTALTRRCNPVYPATVVGPPPMEDAWLGKATERIFMPLLRLLVPDLVDLDLPVEGVFHNLAIVSIRKRYPGHARQVMSALWGLGLLALTKVVVVVDEDVDVHDYRQVTWVVGTSVDPGRDVTVVWGPVDALDHAAPYPAYGTKMGIDATRKWPGEGQVRPWPARAEMSPEIRELVDRRWEEYGLGSR
ncbi:MAG: menaquinone biosynthesis decarboxylase [Bacillota bacterium]